MPNTNVQVDGSRIRERREVRGLTQGQLAYKAGTTVTQISRLENDERPGTQAVILAKIADALGTSVDYFVGLTDDPLSPDRQSSKLGADEIDPAVLYRLQEVARKMTLLSPEDREKLTRQYLTLLEFALSLKGIEEEEQHEGS